MGKFFEYIGSQMGNPRGIIGKIVTWGMNRANKVMYNGIVSEVNLQQNNVLLDVGFGNGYLIQKLYAKQKCTIYGIDISKDMITPASKKNNKGIEEGNIHLSVGDCCNLDFQDCTFHIVTTMNTIYFWNDTLKGLKEIYRVLKDDGIFVNAVVRKESLKKIAYTKNVFKLFEKEDYIKLGKQAGFSDIEIKDLSNGFTFLVIYRK